MRSPRVAPSTFEVPRRSVNRPLRSCTRATIGPAWQPAMSRWRDPGASRVERPSYASWTVKIACPRLEPYISLDRTAAGNRSRVRHHSTRDRIDSAGASGAASTQARNDFVDRGLCRCAERAETGEHEQTRAAGDIAICVLGDSASPSGARLDDSIRVHHAVVLLRTDSRSTLHAAPIFSILIAKPSPCDPEYPAPHSSPLVELDGSGDGPVPGSSHARSISLSASRRRLQRATNGPAGR